jgi:hypothetical protein
VQTGDTSLPRESAGQFWNKDLNGGWRKIAVQVNFDEPFKTRPIVMVALKRFDLGDFSSNIHRIGVGVENVSTKGFQLYFETWHQSLIYEAVVAWIAVSS